MEWGSRAVGSKEKMAGCRRVVSGKARGGVSVPRERERETARVGVKRTGGSLDNEPMRSWHGVRRTDEAHPRGAGKHHARLFRPWVRLGGSASIDVSESTEPLHQQTVGVFYFLLSLFRLVSVDIGVLAAVTRHERGDDYLVSTGVRPRRFDCRCSCCRRRRCTWKRS